MMSDSKQLPLQITQASTLVFVDGIFSDSLSDKTLLAPGLLECDSGSGTIVLSVPKNSSMTAPVVLSFLTTKSGSMPSLTFIIKVGANSQLTLIEEHSAAGELPYARNITMQIKADASARIHYVKLQNESSAATHIASLHIQQQKDSHIDAFYFTKGALVAEDVVDVGLQAQGATCQLHGLYVLKQDKQDIRYRIVAHHQASHTASKMLFKGTLDHQTKVSFLGKVHVQEQAQHISAHQENHNLLLSKLAEVDSKPELEIYANDIKCTHGATVGQIDEDALFYLQSRGIPAADAHEMLIKAFSSDIFQYMPESDVRNALQQWVYHVL